MPNYERGLTAVDKKGGKVLFLNPATYQRIAHSRNGSFAAPRQSSQKPLPRRLAAGRAAIALAYPAQRSQFPR